MRLALLTVLAMVAFASNSLLNRMAVGSGDMDPLGFALVRLASGTAMLLLLVGLRAGYRGGAIWPGWAGRSLGVAGLLTYLIGFSVAYVALPAGPGALILFGTVQITMFGGALLTRERVPSGRWAGAALAFVGLVVLVAPGGGDLSAGPVLAMILAGAGWGIYSLAGRGAADALGATAANFTLALVVMAGPALWLSPHLNGFAGGWGMALAILSGAVTSGLGYALWYRILPTLGAARAAVAQLSVPVIAGAGGAVLLGEPLGARFALAAALVLSGVGWAALAGRERPGARMDKSH